METLPPHNIDAECGVLGSMIIDPEAILRVADLLQPADFYRDAHRTIYEAMLALIKRNEPADFLTLCDELERQGTLEQIGGASFLTSLISGVPTSGNVESYARIVREVATHRRLIQAAGKIAAFAYAREPDALTRAEELIFSIAARSQTRDFVTSEAAMMGVLTDLERLHQRQGELSGVSTGFRALDHCLGGLQPGDLIVAAGRPGMGKTAFALSLAYNAMRDHQARVAIFSLEMTSKQLMGRLLSMHTGIESQQLRNGHLADSEWDNVIAAEEVLSALPLFLDDAGSLALATLRSKARRLQANQAVDLVIVDYLQLLQAESLGKRIEPRLREVEEISSGLKAMAKELGVPVLALAQLSRAVESRADKVPQLADLRESGSIESDADVALLLYRDEYYHTDSRRPETADVIVAKHRNGPTGEITLCFDAPHTRFFNNRDEKRRAYKR